MIGGGPAAAVVFSARGARARAARPADRARCARELRSERPSAEARGRLRARRSREVTLEKQAELAAEFDAIHTVERAREVGSLRGDRRAGGACAPS